MDLLISGSLVVFFGGEGINYSMWEIQATPFDLTIDDLRWLV